MYAISTDFLYTDNVISKTACTLRKSNTHVKRSHSRFSGLALALALALQLFHYSTLEESGSQFDNICILCYLTLHVNVYVIAH